MVRLEEIADELRTIAASVEPRELAARDAATLTNVAADAERLCAALKVLFARRAVDGNGWRARTDAVVPEQWYARLSGCSESEARRALKLTERLEALPATEAKLRDGSLSLAQAAICAEGATADPSAEDRLLRIAGKGEMRRLREVEERVVTAAMDEAEARKRAHRDRSLRTWTQGLSTHGCFQGPTEDVAVLLAAIEPLKRQAFTAGRKAEEFETADAYRFDGLVELSRRAMHVGGDTQTKDVAPVTRLRVDLDRLLGHDDAGEVCEIPGIGPVPVAHARQVLPHGLLELVITDGVDVRTVVSKTRHVPEALKIAIEERDQTCKIEGCDRTEHLERHHVEDYAEKHLTIYELLGRLCELHHDLVTYRGYTIEPNPDGSWRLRPPDEQRDTDAA